MEQLEPYETERYFRFMPPKNVGDWYYFVSGFQDPYDGLDEKSNEQRKLDEFRLPYKYDTTPYYEGPLDIGDIIEDIREWKHKWVEMTDEDIRVSFLKRAVEYFKLDVIENVSNKNLGAFLNYHYVLYPDEKNQWLDYVFNLFSGTDNKFMRQYYYDSTKTFELSKFKKEGQKWINQRRETEAFLEEGEKIEKEEKLKRDIVAHKIALLRGLGILNYLQEIRKTTWPNISDVDLAKLVAIITGLKDNDTIRKAIFNTEPDSWPSRKKAKSELAKIGIDFPIDLTK